MNIRFRNIAITVALVAVSSTVSGSFGYKIGKHDGVLEKNAAVKGIEYDLRDKLSKEAIGKAQEIVDEETLPEGSGQKNIKDFYKLLNEEKYEDAWKLLSEDYQKELKSLSNFKNSNKNIKTIEVKNIEFRTSTPLSEMDMVTLEITYKTPSSTQKDGKVIFYINSSNDKDKWLIDEISKE